MSPPTPVPLLDGGAFFESPRWHDGRWWVSDFYREAVYTVSVDGTEQRVLEVGHQPSGLGWLPDGSLLVVSMKDQRLLRRDADGNVSVHADRQILTSVVSNMLQNAFKFTHPNGQVLLRAHATVDRVLIDVEDQCGGLPPGSVEELFRPYEQRGSDRTGLGLGLSICYKIMQAHGGTIHAENRPGGGTEFLITFPIPT